MDSIDKKIVAELVRNGRLSVTELGERVGLTISPCHRRLRALEEGGIITGYRAIIAPPAIGLSFSAIVFATLSDVQKDKVARFEEALPEIPEIVQAQRLFGEPDYMLHIVTKDLPAFQLLYDRTLSSLPGLRRLNSTLVMKDIIRDRPPKF